MKRKAGRAIGYWILAVSIFIAGFLVVSEPAFAHGNDGTMHAPLVIETPDPEHVENGHPGHCHGGSFCNGVAMAVVPPAAPELASRMDRQTLAAGHFRALAVYFFDPPPPRILS